ncbi:MAG: hypothetical protein GY839_06170 [candidate division Zixibacteria bacterium]|nr:hypothetical protein [candidate division Zixibacteria bacterium]
MEPVLFLVIHMEVPLAVDIDILQVVVVYVVVVVEIDQLQEMIFNGNMIPIV